MTDKPEFIRGLVTMTVEERDELRVENERLNQALDMLAEQREAWETDNERLRAALEKIANGPDVPAFGGMRQIAREALDHAKEC